MKQRLWVAFPVAASLFGLFLLGNLFFPLPPIPDFSTQIFDKDGRLIHVFLSADDKWRLRASANEVSPLFRSTILFKEDKYFRYHPGVNPIALFRAAINNLLKQKRTSGASTITMQVARLLEKRPRTLRAKAVEMFRAMQLEWKYSKDDILQLYFNLLPYGGNVEGVKAASLIYFDKLPQQLSLAEVITLSVIPNRPTTLHPLRAVEELGRQRNKWLQRLRTAELIDDDELTDALSEPMNIRYHALPRAAPHFSHRMKSGSGSEVHTTLDLNLQLKIEKLVYDYSRAMRQQNIRNAAVVAIDNRNMKVIAYIGSADFSNTEDAGQVDGVRAIRQPGSTLKPLLYGLCIDKGLITPKTILYDVPVNYSGFAPENYDNRFNGAVSAEFALMNSLNVPAVNLLNQLQVTQMVNVLIRAGFRQVKADRNRLGLSLILGGCGVTLEELTTLYAAFANSGVYRPLVFRQSTTSGLSDTLLSAAASFMITETLSSLSRTDLPANWQEGSNTPRIAWKTGTSYGRRDAWSIGYNRSYTVGVWLGNFSGEGAPDLNGANTATPLLFDIFNTIDYNRNAEWYSMPGDCMLRYVCSETGLVPNSFCNRQVMDYYLPVVSANAVCNHLKEVAVSADGKQSFCTSCRPSAGYKMQWFSNVPPELRAWYDERQIAYERVPPHYPDCPVVYKSFPPRIVTPVNGMQYLLNEDEPEPLELSCLVEGDVQFVYWFANDRLLQKAEPGMKVFFTPEEGRCKISCSDDKGRNTDVLVEVKKIRL